MSRWIRGIYIAAANFNLSNALRATRMGGVDRDGKHVRESSDKCDQHVEPCKPCQSGSCATTGATCPRSPTCDEYGIPCRHGATSPCTAATEGRSAIIGNDVVITVNSEFITAADYIEHEYAEYTATVRTQGQGNSTGVWIGNESRDFKHSNNAARTNVEHLTGIPTGVTI